MRKLLVLLVLSCCLWPLPANAQGFYDIIKAYHEGREARQQEDLNDQKLLMMQEESQRIKAEREYLESLKKDIDQQQETKTEKVKSEQKEKDRRAEALAAFEKNVKPRILRVHPDFDEIMKSKTYWAWAEAQEPDLKRCAMDSPDAADIIWAINEYKKAGKIENMAALASPPPPTPEILIHYDRNMNVDGFQIYDKDTREYVFMKLSEDEAREIRNCTDKQIAPLKAALNKAHSYDEKLRTSQNFTESLTNKNHVPCDQYIREKKLKEFKQSKY